MWNAAWYSQVQEIVGNRSHFTYIQLSDMLHQTQHAKVPQTQTQGFMDTALS